MESNNTYVLTIREYMYRNSMHSDHLWAHTMTTTVRLDIRKTWLDNFIRVYYSQPITSICRYMLNEYSEMRFSLVNKYIPSTDHNATVYTRTSFVV